jgi:hypothetical protein
MLPIPVNSRNREPPTSGSRLTRSSRCPTLRNGGHVQNLG